MRREPAPRPRLTTLLRLAITGGRVDVMRIALTLVGAGTATVALLTAVTVASIGPSNGPYGLDVLNQPGLRPGVITVLLLFCVPILSFVGQCVRVGAPARDRRLAALRMAGGTPGDVRGIVALETGLAATAGAVVGAGVYVVLHSVLRHPEPRLPPEPGRVESMIRVAGAPNLPTDVWPTWWLFGIACLLVPVGATVASLIAMRRISISPFGVLHRQSHRPPAVAPAILFVVGVAGLVLWGSVAQKLGTSEGGGVFGAVALLLFVMAVAGLVFGTAALAYQIGTWLAPRTGHPALLIASRRLVDAPFTASRPSSVVVLAVMLGSAVQGTRASFLAITDPTETFYQDTFTLLDVVLAVGVAVAVAGLMVTAVEGVIARRRALAALAASGTPRRVLGEAVLLETVVPLGPAIILASAAGLFAARGLFGTSGAVRQGSAAQRGAQVSVPIPWAELVTLAGGTLVAVCAVTAVALLFLRRSTELSELRAAA